MSNRTELDQLRHVVQPADLDALLRIAPDELLGSILRLNMEPRYQNTLDAIVLTARLLALRSDHPRPGQRDQRSDSSPHIPASSGRMPRTLGGQVLLYSAKSSGPATQPS